MKSFNEFLAESAATSTFKKDMQKELKKDLAALTKELAKIEAAIAKFNEIGRGLKVKFNGLPTVRGKNLSNIDNPQEYNAWVSVTNLSDGYTWRETVKNYKINIELLSK